MKHIFENLKKYWYFVILILALLVVQAYCDLSLPDYTSNIIDVGILNGGVEHQMPEFITENSYNSLKLFLNEQETKDWDNAYEFSKSDKAYKLKNTDKDNMEELDSEFGNVIAVYYMMSSQQDSQFKNMSGNAQQMTPEQQQEMAKKLQEFGVDPQSPTLMYDLRKVFEKKLSSLGDSTISSYAKSFAKSEYKACGKDLDKLQTDYMFKTGAKMISMTLLMVIAAILVGFFASKTAAGVGRDLREKIFTKVMSFSNAELDKFSTASLITRSTNDVQQIQMVSVMLLRMVLYAPILAIGGIINVVNYSSGMEWTIVLAVAVVVCIIGVLMVVAMPKFNMMQKLVDKVNLISREILTGLSVIRAFSREKKEEERFEEANGNLTRVMLFTNRAMSFMMPALMFVMNGVSVLIIWVAAKKENIKKDELATSVVKIDFDGITDRIVKLPVSPSYYGNFYSDGNKVYYWGRGGTKVFDLKEQKEDVVADGASMDVEPGSKKALFFKNNALYVTDIPLGKADLSDPVNLSNMKITVDYPKEWEQIFDEAWRAFRDGFYLENMHGVDWNAVKAKYQVLVPYAKTRLDLNYIIGEMIGELNCGHAYVNPGEAERPDRIKTGMLGAEISRDKSGFFRLEKILPGASWSKSLRSPLAEPGIEAKVGEFIVAIDGVPTNSVKDMYSLLVGKADVPTEISLNSKPQLEGARKIVISPLEEEYSLYHYNWVQDNIKKVDKASNGKIGYIYIPDMGPEGLNEFSRYFYPQLDKEGLIIDDRANGGGNVSPMILERLSREPYRLTMRRGSARIGTVPDAVQVGPKVCLINKYSASDGDLFPWGFRALGLGKLIGTRTWGGIVGISGSLPYMDGTDIRVPFFTSFDPKTGNWIIENQGVDPDILIDNDPVKEWNGEDQQLDRAIQEVMKELQNRKPLPGVPTPRDFSK